MSSTFIMFIKLTGIKAELGVKIDGENEEIVLNGSHFVEACNCYLCLSSEF